MTKKPTTHHTSTPAIMIQSSSKVITASPTRGGTEARH